MSFKIAALTLPVLLAVACGGEMDLELDTESSELTPAMCTAPIALANVSQPTTVVGTGAGTCTEALFAAAVARGGVITFNCGGAATIRITSQKELPRNVNTVIDGGGLITLDGGGTTRILNFTGPGWRNTRTTVTLQRLTIANGRATGTAIPPAPLPCSSGFAYDGGGGAVLIRDGILRVNDVTFNNNRGASPGPDVAGGAIYARGSLEVTITNSRFNDNSGSNGGAVGALFSTLTIVNSQFNDNAANGFGANFEDPTCPVQPMNNRRQRGSGGNGGAVLVDGGDASLLSLACNVFARNTAGATGGAVFRTPNALRQPTTIDRSTFDTNSAVDGGGAFYFTNTDLAITNSTMRNNSAPRGGALQADRTYVTLTNDTFTENRATVGNGGTIILQLPGTARATNVTFASNHADAGNGKFGAALAGSVVWTISNSLFVNNTTQDAWSPMTCTNTGSGTGNLQWPRNHIVGTRPDSPCTTNIGWSDAQLSPLQDNGGATLTMIPSVTSPARNIGTACPATDQRGVARPANGCTAGSVQAP
jgi:hypothetical protein